MAHAGLITANIGVYQRIGRKIVCSTEGIGWLWNDLAGAEFEDSKFF